MLICFLFIRQEFAAAGTIKQNYANILVYCTFLFIKMSQTDFETCVYFLKHDIHSFECTPNQPSLKTADMYTYYKRHKVTTQTKSLGM